MDVFSVLNMIGGLALFLYGINVMGDGLKKTSGGKLESILGKITSNKVTAVLIGAAVTAIMQSSSATTVMIVGFVNSGLMELAKSVMVIMGANIGATITPWVMSLSSVGGGGSVLLRMCKPTSFAPILAIIGVFIILISKNQKRKDLAQVFVGFAVLMFGMSTMSEAVSPLSKSQQFSDIMMMFSNPILGTLAGVALTAIIQSSSATIGMVQVLSTSGLITFGTAIPLLLGANIGTCATALLSSIGTGRDARRAALVHLFYNITRVSLFLIIFYSLNAVFRFPLLGTNATAVGIAIFDTCLSLTSAVLLMPISNIFVKLTYLVLPEKPEEEGAKSEDIKVREINAPIKLLDDHFLNTPSLAVEQAKRVADDMANYTREALYMAIGLFDEYKAKRAEKVARLEDLVDRYEDELSTYLIKISSKAMDEKTSHTLNMILHSVGDFERISDHAMNIMLSAKEMHEKELDFSKRAKDEIVIFTEALKDTVNSAFDSYIDNDLYMASQVEPLEEVIDELNEEIKKRHIKRLRKGKCSIEMGFILSDLSNNYERVSDHCSNIAISLLQREADMGSHEFQTAITSKSNEEYIRRVKVYSEKYKLPKKVMDAE